MLLALFWQLIGLFQHAVGLLMASGCVLNVFYYEPEKPDCLKVMNWERELRKFAKNKNSR